MIRIVGGTHRGRRLEVPPGDGVRPTADRARESIFNMLAHGAAAVDLEGATVLDLFCGTGAFGLEAVSRGAARAILVDSDPAVLKVAEANAATLREHDQVTLLRGDATKALPGRAPAPVAVAFLDPPYGKALAEPALVRLAAGGWLAPDARVIVELGRDEPFAPPDAYEVIDERRYGAARVVFLSLTGA